MLDKALYELNYELNNRPDWVRIPLAAILGRHRQQVAAPAGHAAGLDGSVSPDSPTWRAGAALQITADTARRTRFGALPEAEGVRFRVPAPPSRQLQLRLLTGAAAGMYRLDPQSGDTQVLLRPGRVRRRSLHLFDRRLRPAPDPASRFQPDGVHGLPKSSILDAFRWQHQRLDRATATRAHRLRAARRHLHAGRHVRGARGSGSASCAISASRPIELMPVAEFAGTRNWGYDGVCLYAPSRTYGRPDDLRALRRCALTGSASPSSSTSSTTTSGPRAPTCRSSIRSTSPIATPRPWGGGVNLDGPGSRCRAALHRRQRGVTGSASTSSMACGSTRRTRSSTTGRRTSWRRSRPRYAPPHRGRWRFMPRITATSQPSSMRRSDGGWGLDGVWADDFHHVLRAPPRRRPARLLPGLHRIRRRAGADAAAGLAVHGPALGARQGAARHRPVAPADVPVRRLPAESRSDRQPRDRRSAAPLDRCAGMACRQHPAPHVADDAAAVHGAGMGRLEPVPVLHRSRARARSAGHRRTPARVRGLSGVHRSCGAPAHSRSTGCGNVRAQHARLERARTAGARAVARALHRAAATAEYAPRARCNGRDIDRSGGHRRRHDRHAAQRRRRAVPGCRPACKAQEPSSIPLRRSGSARRGVVSRRRVPVTRAIRAADRDQRRRPAGARDLPRARAQSY